MISWVGPAGFESSRSGSAYATGAKHVCMVLATGGMPMNVSRF
jgi:hypothetical protein